MVRVVSATSRAPASRCTTAASSRTNGLRRSRSVRSVGCGPIPVGERRVELGEAAVLPVGIDSGTFAPFREQPFREVQALLHLAYLQPQLVHLGVEAVDRVEYVDLGFGLAATDAPPQVLGPYRERHCEPRVGGGVHRLGRR